ncbi:MAG: ABC transporter ATP-binding protein [Armatimonadota bacterium]|nr:MAG: ABC transporter ATP-binding protein [Armatimonadota bacterium]
MRLELREVSAAYNGEPVIADISLGVSDGEFVGLVGPNGSGKSTVVRVMSRVLRPQSGEALLDGGDIFRMPSAQVARHIAVVPQDSSYYFDYSVTEIVLMGRSPHMGRFALEGAQDYAAAERAMQLTGIAHLAQRPVTATSGGERQRVAIARALAADPQLLILDEPTAHLDINHQIEVLDLVRALNREQRVAVVVVMHDLNLAAQYCGRMLLLHQGRPLAEGPPQTVITAQHVRHAYGTEVAVKSHPVTGRPYFTLLSRLPITARREGLAVHVICGAGTGTELMERLIATGCRVSAGVLNVEDSDQQTAERLALPRAEEAPFSPISDDAQRENARLIEVARAVVVTPIPVGAGNLANLEAALAAARADKRVIIVNSPPIEERDFAQGRAADLQREIEAAGAEVVRGIEDAVRLVAREADAPASGGGGT